MTRPATAAQLLILVDRAERGVLTGAEAARLRAGISGLYRERRAAGARQGAQTRFRRGADGRLEAVAALVHAARRRGAHAVPVRALDIALGAQLDASPKPPRTMAVNGVEP